jgi:hypothetical protein
MLDRYIAEYSIRKSKDMSIDIYPCNREKKQLENLRRKGIRNIGNSKMG